MTDNSSRETVNTRAKNAGVIPQATSIDANMPIIGGILPVTAAGQHPERVSPAAELPYPREGLIATGASQVAS